MKQKHIKNFLYIFYVWLLFLWIFFISWAFSLYIARVEKYKNWRNKNKTRIMTVWCIFCSFSAEKIVFFASGKRKNKKLVYGNFHRKSFFKKSVWKNFRCDWKFSFSKLHFTFPSPFLIFACCQECSSCVMVFCAIELF